MGGPGCQRDDCPQQIPGLHDREHQHGVITSYSIHYTKLYDLIVGIFGPTANGDRFALFQILDATMASVVIVALLIGLTLTRLPWRYVPGTGERYSGEDLGPGALSGPTPRPPADRPNPDAYADSP